MITKRITALCLATTFGIAGAAFAQTGGTTAATTAADPTKLNFTLKCPGGGTRVSTGTWNSGTGALDISVAVTNCKWGNDEMHTGTRKVTGTLTSGALQTFKINLTMEEKFTVTRDGATKLTHTCTVTKKGTLDDPGDRFTGISTRSCTDDGEVWDPDHWVENIMRHTLAIDVDKQDPVKVVVPPRGPGNACNKHNTSTGGTTGTGTAGTTGTGATGTTSRHEEGEICGDKDK